METPTIRELMPQIPQYFIPEKAAGIDAVTQFHITGEGGGDWAVTIRDQKCSVEEGTTPNPNLSLTAGAQDVYDLLNRKLDPMKAFMQGKVRFTGNMGLAMKLANLFRMPSGLG